MRVSGHERQIRPPVWVGYVFTVVAELVTTAVLRLLLPVFPLAEFPAPYLLVLMISAYLFGTGPAILAFCMGLLLYVYTLPPYHDIWPVAPTPRDLAGIIDLLVGSAIVGFAAIWAGRSKHSVEMLADDLREASRHTTDVLESIAECFIALDPDLRVVDLNSVAEQTLFMRSGDEVIGRSLLEEYPQLVGSEFEKKCRDAFALQSRTSFEDKLWLPDKWFECHVFPFGDCMEVYLRDISRRRQAEEAVRDSEFRYRSLVETMNEGFCVADAHYVFTYANPRYAEMIGYAQEEIVGHSIMEFLDEPGRKLLTEQIAEREAGRYAQYELTWAARDGRDVHTLISPRPLFDRSGAFVGSFAAVTDITDLKHSEEALRDSERRYRELFHNANDAVFLVDKTQGDVPGRFIEVNDVACQRLGYTREEMLRMGPRDVLSPETAARHSEMMSEMGENGYSTFEVEQVTRDGRRIPTELSAHQFQLGDLTVILAIARDITERKLAEETLRRSEERFRNLFEQNADALYLHDLKGRLLDVNRAACDALGYSREELLEMSVRDVVVDWEQSALDELWSALSVSPQTVYATHRRKDGSRLSVEGRLSMQDYRGQHLVLAVVRDITERLRVEEERRVLEQHMEEQKRLFYRETIFSVTGGILDICDDKEVAPYISSAEVSIEAQGPEQASNARRTVEAFLRGCGLSGDRLDLFLTGVGEAITNATKHGTEGKVYAGCRGESVWVGVADNGPGIESLILPRAVLLRGFSTKPSLGLGYCVMLEAADCIHLKTDERGTVVILEKDLVEGGRQPSLDKLPDTWARSA